MELRGLLNQGGELNRRMSALVRNGLRETLYRRFGVLVLRYTYFIKAEKEGCDTVLTFAAKLSLRHLSRITEHEPVIKYHQFSVAFA